MIMHLAAALGTVTTKVEPPATTAAVITPSLTLVLIGLVLAAIAGLGAAVLHRGDYLPITPPLAPQRYSTPAAAIRGINTALASAPPLLAALIANNHEHTILVLLLATFAGIGYALAHRSDDSSTRVAIWHGWNGFLAFTTLGQGITIILAIA
ncbi:hypothetical protein ACFVJI_34030 [Streptomyces sp. NPDC127584]|uniref:hypothetical protein n=1 Tax=Streptomyces sp. NPDC127584 TaxID=3345403 RepID=UPI003626A6AB